MKKIILCIIYLLTVIFFFLGCNKVEKVDIQGKNNIPGLENLKKNQLDFVELNIVKKTKNSLPRSHEQQKEIIGEINKILEKKINTNIKIEYIICHKGDDEIFKRVFSGDNIDIIDADQKYFKNIINESNIADLTEILPIYYPEIYENDINISDIYINDRIYSMPKIITRTNRDRIYLVVKRELFEQAGKPHVNSIKDIINLYEYGISHKNEEGKAFLGAGHKQFFAVQFHTFINLFCQEYEYKQAPLLLTMKNGKIKGIESTEVLKEWYNTVQKLCSQNAVSDHPFPSVLANDQVGMGLIESNYIHTNWLGMDFHESYEVMFVNDFEPYFQRTLQSMALIYNNDHVKRSVMTLRLLYEDKTLNHLIQYGIVNKHYKIINDKIKMLPRTYNICNWWPVLSNRKHGMEFIYEPEDAKKYYNFLYYTPKKIITDRELNFYNINIKDAVESNNLLKEAYNERVNFLMNLVSYTENMKEDIPYKIFIQEMIDMKKQNIFIDNIRNLYSPLTDLE